MSYVLDYFTSSALSLTVAGNTGISPFFTLLLLGAVEKSDPTLLNMDGWIETLLSSTASIVVLAVLTSFEFIAKCVPFVDEIIDSIEVFVVPIISIFGSLGTLGLLDLAQQEQIVDTVKAEIDERGGGDDGDGRRLGVVSDSLLIFLKVILVLVGIGLSLAIHLFKMLVRLIGLTCCVGICQPCITTVEIMTVVTGVLLAIYIRQIAIATCTILFLVGAYAIKRKFFDKKDENDNNDSSGAQQPAPTPAPEPEPTPPAQPATGPSTATNATSSGSSGGIQGNNDNMLKAETGLKNVDEESPAVPTSEPAEAEPVAQSSTAPTTVESSGEEGDIILPPPVLPPPATNPGYVGENNKIPDAKSSD